VISAPDRREKIPLKLKVRRESSALREQEKRAIALKFRARIVALMTIPLARDPALFPRLVAARLLFDASILAARAALLGADAISETFQRENSRAIRDDLSVEKRISKQDSPDFCFVWNLKQASLRDN